MAMRSVVKRCVQRAARASSVSRVALTVKTPVTFVRACSSSRFLSLADEDGKKPAAASSTGDDGEGDDRTPEEIAAAAEAGETATGEGDVASVDGEKDGELELEELEMYKFCVTETEEMDGTIMELYMSNPSKWTPERLARKFHLSKQRVEATIFFEAENAGLSLEELQQKIEDAKALAVQREQDEHAKLASAESRGDEKEVKRLQKRERQEQRDLDEVDEEELTAEEQALVLGLDDERYRNPDFFFLKDEFDGLPPLTRRLGKHKSTDKLYPEEALEIQRLATNNVITEHKSFAMPTEKKNRWKMAIKDTSKNKLPLLVRGEDRTLRLATNEEVMPRTWVRRPAFFAGLNPSAK